MLKAVIFDIDGTLVDSVDLHAHAWQDAFRHFGHDFDFHRIRSQIGKGGDQLLPVFLNTQEVEERGQEIRDYREELYKKKYLDKVKAFPNPEKFSNASSRTARRSPSLPPERRTS